MTLQYQADVVVIGGGIYGACVFRDLAKRGFSVVLLERDDFGSATSHNSFKLIHSGIRYLQHLDIPRVCECIGEVENWIRMAPDLVQPIRFVIPSYGFNMRSKEVMWAGGKAHDFIKLLMGAQMPRSGTMSVAETLTAFPQLPQTGLRGASYWYDGQVQDTNKVIYRCIEDGVRTGNGMALPYSPVQELLLEGDRVTGVRASNIANERIEVTGQVVVNATGPWLADLLPEELRPQQYNLDAHFFGQNLVIDRHFSEYALGMQGAEKSDSAVGQSGRLYFMAPWQGKTVLGTSHIPAADVSALNSMSSEGLAPLIADLNNAFPFLQLTEEEVAYVYRGFTPAAGDGESLTRSRKFAVVDHAQEAKRVEGLISVIGVKLTSSRFIAEKVTDLIEQKTGRGPVACETGQHQLPVSDMEAGTSDDAWLQREDNALPADMSLSDYVTCRLNIAEMGNVSFARLTQIATMLQQRQNWSDEQLQQQLQIACTRLRLTPTSTFN